MKTENPEMIQLNVVKEGCVENWVTLQLLCRNNVLLNYTAPDLNKVQRKEIRMSSILRNSFISRILSQSIGNGLHIVTPQEQKR